MFQQKQAFSHCNYNILGTYIQIYSWSYLIEYLKVDMHKYLILCLNNSKQVSGQINKLTCDYNDLCGTKM